MASIWTIFTKGYAEYEMEKAAEPYKKYVLEQVFKEGFYSRGNNEIQEAYEYAKDVGDSEKRKLLYDELKRRGLNP